MFFVVLKWQWWNGADRNANAAEHTAVEDLVRRSIRSLVVNTQDLPDGKAASGRVLTHLCSDTWDQYLVSHVVAILLPMLPVTVRCMPCTITCQHTAKIDHGCWALDQI